MTLNALLEELGCNKSEIDEFILMGEENRYDAQQRLLRKNGSSCWTQYIQAKKR